MSNISNDGEKLAFLNGLKQYLEDRGKILIPYPRLAGKVLDLHDLYNRVTSLGGYTKVTERDLWEEFLSDYDLPNSSSSLSYGLRSIYQRFLEEYERVHHFGEDEGNKKNRFVNSIRRTRNPDYISDQDRRNYGLSVIQGSRFGDYERLVSALISCLPNEIDFAINACTLLSGESRHVLRLPRCPQVLDALLLHAGIVSQCEGSYEGIAIELAKTGRNVLQFWTDTVDDLEVLREMLPSCSKDALTNDTNDGEAVSVPKIELSKSKKWPQLFESKRSLGIQEHDGQRILQISLVLLNLSFEDVNVVLLAKSRELVRFIFLCIYSNYSALKQTGLDILGNVSACMNLNHLGHTISQCTYKTLAKCTSSADKFVRIRGFEILGNLCRSESNKDNLVVSVADTVISAAVLCLPLSDIELIVAALEALYRLSRLGEETCTKIMLIPHSIELLVGLITINIRSFGSEQLSKIRIARRVVHHPQPPQPPVQRPTYSTPYRAPPAMPAVPLMRATPPVPLRHIAPNPPNPITPTPSQPPTSMRPPTAPQRVSKPVDAGPMYTHTDKHATPPVFHYMPAPPPDIVLDKSPESFAQLWTWATYEACPSTTGSTPRVQLFAEYAAAASRYGMNSRSQVLPAADFGRCLQRVFPHTASRLFNDKNGQPLYHITGIQKRQTPLPVPGHHPQVNNGDQPHPPTQTGQHIQHTTGHVPVFNTNQSSSRDVSQPTTIPASAQNVKNIQNTDSNPISCHTSSKPSVAQLPQSHQLPTDGLKSSKTLSNGALHEKNAETSDEKFSASIFPIETHRKELQNGDNGNSPKTNQPSETLTNHCTAAATNNIETKDHKLVSKTPSVTKKSNENASLCNGNALESEIKSKEAAINGIPDPHKTKEELKEPMMNGISDAEDKISPQDVSKPLLITPPNITQAAQPQTSPINPNQLQHYYVAQHNKAAKPAAEDTIQSNPSPHLLADTTQPTSQAQTMNVQAHGMKRSLPPSAVVSDEPATKSARITTSLPSAPDGQPTLHKPSSDQKDQPSTPQLDQSMNHHEPNTILTSQVTRPPVQPQVGASQGLPNQTQVGAISVQPQVGAPPVQPQVGVSQGPSNQPQVGAPQVSPNQPQVGAQQVPQAQPQVGAPRHRKSQGLDLMADNASLMVLFRNVGKQPMEDYTDEKEDPISKSVRLTSVLILINISNFCSEGRSMLQVHEPRFAHLAMSAMDCSPMLAKLLAGLDR